jgi:hypothetical protein
LLDLGLLHYKPPLFVSTVYPQFSFAHRGGNLVVRPSTKFVCLVLSCLAVCAAATSSAWAQTPGGTYKPPTGPAANKRPGTPQRASYQEEGQPVEMPPVENLPMPVPDQTGEAGPTTLTKPYYEQGDQVWMEDGSGYVGNQYCGGGPLGCGIIGSLWVRGEWLVWDLKGMNTPALVIGSTVNNIDPEELHLNDNGDLGVTGPIVILYGGHTLNSDIRGGAKISFGIWLDDCNTVGLEAEYYGLEDTTDSFFRNSTGSPILARPFYNILTGLESSEVVAFPTEVNGVQHTGLIDIDATTRFQGAGARALINLGCNSGCGVSWWNGCPMQTASRVDLVAGYRFLRLDDSLRIVERSTLDPGGQFDITDRFEAENTFNGFDFGMKMKHQRGCWSFDVLSRVSLGTTRSEVDIAGRTIITPTGAAAERFVGGILAQRTNIGHYQADEFAVVPEMGFNVGYQLNPCWKLTAGYTWLYWSRVARAGDQIDRDLNPELIPEEVDPPADSHLRPGFRFVHDDFWAHGLRLGLEGSW